MNYLCIVAFINIDSDCRDWWWSRQLCSCYSCHKTQLRAASFAVRVNHVDFWRYSSISCAYFTTIAKGSFSKLKTRTYSYRAMRISRDTSVGSSIVRVNVLRRNIPFEQGYDLKEDPPLPSAKRLLLLPVPGNSQSNHQKCLIKVFGGSRVNMSCSSSMTCTIAKWRGSNVNLSCSNTVTCVWAESSLRRFFAEHA